MKNNSMNKFSLYSKTFRISVFLKEINKMKKLICLFILLFTGLLSFAEENDIRIVPILNYDFVSVENQNYHLPGGGLILMKGNHSPLWNENPDNLMVGAVYKTTIINNVPFDYSNVFHSVELIGELRKNRHFIQGLISSYSDMPFYGGLHTTYSQIGYGYQFIRREYIKLTVGAAFGISDFGFDLPNGGTWPLLPSPIIEFEFFSSLFNLSFIWPELKTTIGPESRIRMTSTVKLEIWKFNDIHDMLFDCILWYRFFDKNFVYGDFAGAGIGIKNSGLDFTLNEKGNYYNTHYYSLFGILDAGLLKVSGGYIFYSREFYGNSNVKLTGKGWFIGAQILYQF